MNSFERGLVVEVLYAVRQPQKHSLFIHLAGPRDLLHLQQGLNLGAKIDGGTDASPEERFFPESIAAQEQFAGFEVVKSQGPETIQSLETIGAPMLIGLEENLGIAPRAELDPFGLELVTEFKMVVNLAIEHDAAGTVIREERLVPRGGEVNDGEPPMGQSDVGLRVHPRCQHRTLDPQLRAGRLAGKRQGLIPT